MADFNENGFIDEEDLQRIILRLLNSDDMSEGVCYDQCVLLAELY